MKIAHITSEYSANGGVGVYLLRASKSLQARGHQNVVIHNDSTATEDGSGVRQYYIEKYTQFESRKDQSKIDEVMSRLREENPDIVHVQGSENFALENKIRSEFLAIKTLHVHDYCPAGTKFHYATSQTCKHKTGPMCVPRMIYKRCTKSLRPNVLELFYSRSTKAIRNDRDYSKILVASEYMREQALLNDFRPEQIALLPYFTPEPNTIHHKSDQENMILFAGRVVPEKGLDRLLDALTLLPKELSWKLVVDGDGSELAKMKRKASALGLESKVEFCGWVAQKSHLELYERASIVAVPSIWPEPFGLVGIEAMSYATPVVAFRVGGIPDWLEDDVSGYLIEPYNIKGMAQKIEKLLRNAELRKRMGKQGREIYRKQYTAESHEKKLLAIYEEVICENQQQ